LRYLILLPVILCLNSFPLEAAAKTGYLLEQHERLGLRKIYISDEGIVVEAPNNLDYGMQYKTADKSVTMWSPKKHFYCTLPYTDWIKEFRNMYASAGWYAELSKPISSTVEHLPNANYRTYKFIVNDNTTDYWQSNFGQAKKASTKSQVALLTTIELPVFSQAGAIVSRLYGLPDLRGVPVKLTKENKASLVTKKCSSVDRITLPFFVARPGFTKKQFNSQLFSVKFDSGLTDFMLPY